MQRWILGCLLLPAALGCSREFYRRDADRETYPIIDERVFSPMSGVGRIQVEPAPPARFADPYNPDFPPKPPDDPAAALFMAHPWRFRGAKGWEKDGVVDRIDAPGWEQSLGLNDRGILVLTQDKAVELALLHGRELQTELENVYLSALSLSLNRFDFQLRWFGRNRTDFTRTGASSLPSETNTLSTNTNAGFATDLAAGGQFLVDFANSFVWEFTGKTHTIGSNFGLALVQPLLRNFGRKVRLEALTQQERNVLYAVRDYARFRKRFWVEIAIQSGGFLDLLLSLQTVRNAQANLVGQQENVRLQEALFAGGKVSPVDVDQAVQELQQAQQGVLFAETALQNALDSFKIRLGLPPDIPVELDDRLLSEFILTDPALEAFQAALTTFQKDRLKELTNPPSIPELSKHYRTMIGLLEQLPTWADVATNDLAEWGKELDQSADPTIDPADRARTIASRNQIVEQLRKARTTALELTTKAKQAAERLDPKKPSEEWETLTQTASRAVGIVDTIVSAQTQARINRIKLPTIDLSEEQALEFALDNRLDLANALAGVTDAWRQVTVTANALQADLNLTLAGTLVNAPDARHPFDFANDAGRFSVGLALDGPLNRQAERNAYRAALIGYQRSRRTYLLAEDSVKQQIRRDLRQLRLERQNFEIARRRLLAAARQLEGARIQLLNQREAAGTANALLILNALRALLESRNALAAAFIQYQQQRIQLFLDMEALTLDNRGVPTHESLELFGNRTGSRPIRSPNPSRTPAVAGSELTPQPRKQQ